ncbi:acyloxyacyl hydrolase [Pedobacter sp. BS3]|uniref:acyloxyacyl hydrolase n=1 Tax=Pedobacter sp. BS3 TaxID=2567937 RepID=UPI001659B9E2|nr:acyloxyacyl hydrolase [Pedobacter sp. BS3]
MKYVLLLFSLLTIQTGKAQEINTTLYYGSFLVNTPQDGTFKNYLYGADVNWNHNISNRADNWIRTSGAQSYGLGFMFRQLNNFNGYADTSANAFGQAYGLAGNIKFQLFKLGKTGVYINPAFGISYLTKTYFTNHTNRFIGSHLNMTLKGDLGVSVPLNTNLSFSAGLGMLHYSNGAYVIPNGGLNTTHVFAGLTFQNHNTETEHTKASPFLPLQRNSVELGLGIGRRGIPETHSGKWKSGLYAGYNYRVNDFIRLKAGLDAIYYYKFYDPDQTEGKYKYYGASYKDWRLGLSAGADLNMWRITITGQAGKYLYFDKYYKNVTWYWLFGPTYYITPHIGIQAKTYMHMAQADYINYGLVFQL